MNKLVMILGRGTWILVALLLAGCSMLQPVETPTITEYQIKLDPPRATPESITKPERSLLLRPMGASAPFGSRQMFFIVSEFSLGSYATHQWAAPPQTMLTQFLRAYLIEHSSLFVLPGDYIGLSHFSLVTHLEQLALIREGNRGYVSLQVMALLKDNRGEQLMAQHQFKLRQSTVLSPQGMASASNALAKRFAQELNGWLLRQLKASPVKVAKTHG